MVLIIFTITCSKKDNQITAAIQIDNVPSRKLSRAKEIPKEAKSAVAVLVANTEGDYKDLCLALKSLAKYHIVPNETPILIFHEKSFGRQRKVYLSQCTKAPLTFILVNLDYPPGFDPDAQIRSATEEVEGRIGRIFRLASRLGRKHWGYVQMIRFWNTWIWKHPAVQQFDTLMRIDTDSCFVNVGGGSGADAYLPGLPEPYVYRASGPGLGSDVWIKGLFDFTLDYIQREGVTPSNPALWEYVESSYMQYHTLPVVQTNFEVTQKAFFQRDDVMKWHEALTEEEPYGVFRYRWGDAQIRLLTAAMFGTPDNVLFVSHAGYKHGRGVCAEHFGVAPNQ